MQAASCCFTVDDVCYEGYSSEAHLKRLLDFFGSQDISATFFVVPLAQGRRLEERPEYVRILKRAVNEGHEVAQHGLEHDRFECGIPPEMILALPHEGPARERLKTHRAEIEVSLQMESLRNRLCRGRTILEQGMGREIRGFRAPCLSVCENLFHVLRDEGYLYDSSNYLQETGWDILNNREPFVPRPITRERFDSLQCCAPLRMLPLTTDYTWRLQQDKFDVTLELAEHDVEACFESGIPFVPMSHVSPIQECENDCGFELYRRLVGHAKQRAADRGLESKFLTLSQVCELPA